MLIREINFIGHVQINKSDYEQTLSTNKNEVNQPERLTCVGFFLVAIMRTRVNGVGKYNIGYPCF